MACASSQKGTVIVAASMTLGITFALTAYAVNTKSDFKLKSAIF